MEFNFAQAILGLLNWFIGVLTGVFIVWNSNKKDSKGTLKCEGCGCDFTFTSKDGRKNGHNYVECPICGYKHFFKKE